MISGLSPITEDAWRDALKRAGACDEAHAGVRVASDMVNHPPHYTSHPSGVEAIDVTEHYNFCVGNAIKYLWRAGLKGHAVEDLKKARWYVDREIDRLERTQDANLRPGTQT